MAITTIGGFEKAKFNHKQMHIIALSYECDVLAEPGMAVKFNNDGTVTDIAAATDLPIGIVEVGNKAADGNVTVRVNFSAVYEAKAGAEVANIGTPLSAVAPASEEQKYIAATSGDYVSAIALSSAAADGDPLVVGVLQSPYKL